MFGIGMPELILIMAIALIVIGPKKLPDLARSLGRALGEFKKATGELKSSLGVDEELGDVKQAFDEMNRDIKDAVDVNPLHSTEKKSDPTTSDKSDKTDSGPVGKQPGKTAGEKMTSESPLERPIEKTEKIDDPVDPSTEISETDEINTPKKTAVKKDRGESVGDE